MHSVTPTTIALSQPQTIRLLEIVEHHVQSSFKVNKYFQLTQQEYVIQMIVNGKNIGYIAEKLDTLMSKQDSTAFCSWLFDELVRLTTLSNTKTVQTSTNKKAPLQTKSVIANTTRKPVSHNSYITENEFKKVPPKLGSTLWIS